MKLLFLFLVQLFFIFEQIHLSLTSHISKSSLTSKKSFFKNSLKGKIYKNLIKETNTLPRKCELNLLNFSYQNTVAYPEFLFGTRRLNLKMNNSEIKLIFKFIDSKNKGYFSSKRWNQFNAFFLNQFIKCDTNKDCLLSEEELLVCLKENEDISVAIRDNPDPKILIKNIINSVDFFRVKGMNLHSFLIFKRSIIGFREAEIINLLDQDSFKKAFRISFSSYQLDNFDLDMIFLSGRMLLSKNMTDYFYDFPQYFELSRITNCYLNYGVSISDGILTSQDTITDNDNPSKMTSELFKRYYSLFESEEIQIATTFPDFIDPKIIRYQDYITLEYWANIFTNYTDSSFNVVRLNQTAFEEMVKNLCDEYKNYIAYSNFQDESSLKVNTYFINNTDYEFMMGLDSSFLEKEIHLDTGFKRRKENEKKFAKNGSIFDKLNRKNSKSFSFKEEKGYNPNNDGVNQMTSMFNQKYPFLNPANQSTQNPIQTDISDLLSKGAKNYFNLLNIYDDDKFVYFESLISFVKYLQVYKVLNTNSTDPRGILKTDIVNYRNDILSHPPLSIYEKNKLQTLDSMNCNFIDFLYFVDYMIGSVVFRAYRTDNKKNFVNEYNLLLGLKKMNLNNGDNNFPPFPLVNKKGNSYDYDSAIRAGLDKKCIFNTALYQYKPWDFLSQITAPSQAESGLNRYNFNKLVSQFNNFTNSTNGTLSNFGLLNNAPNMPGYPVFNNNINGVQALNLVNGIFNNTSNTKNPSLSFNPNTQTSVTK